MKIRSLVCSLRCLLINMYSRVLYASISRPFLRLMSSLVSSREPRYLHVFHFGCEVLLTQYFSVLPSLMSRLSTFKFSGKTHSICFILLSSDLRKLMPSAYFGSIFTLCLSFGITQSSAVQITWFEWSSLIVCSSIGFKTFPR